MNLFRKIIYYVTVPKCVCCDDKLDIDDLALCKKCREEYNNHLMRSCSVCAKPLYECTCPNEYLDSHYVHKHIKVYRYKPGLETAPNKLIYSLKRENRHDVLDFLATELASSISASVKSSNEYLFTSVPRMKASRNKYGIDHAKELSKATAKILGAKYKNLLVSKAKKLQKKTKSTEERIANAKYSLKNRKINLNGKKIIIVDDIVTTGASLGSCAAQLKIAGGSKIIGASVAITYKDKYVPFETDDRFSPKHK